MTDYTSNSPLIRNPKACPGWNDEASVSSDNTRTLLPAGIYPFRVTRMEKGYHEPSAAGKLPACHKATLILEVDAGNTGSATLNDNIFLLDRFSWKASAFLRCLDIPHDAQRFRWNLLNECEGRTGCCELGIQEYEGRDHKTRRKNVILRYLEPLTDKSSVPASASTVLPADGEPPRSVLTAAPSAEPPQTAMPVMPPAEPPQTALPAVPAEPQKPFRKGVF